MDEKQAANGYPGTGNPGFEEDESGYPSSYPPHQEYGGYVAQPDYAVQPKYWSTKKGYNSNQSTAVVTQPVADVQVVSSVQDNMCLAIFTTICCCWPIGIFAILRASESRAALAGGYFRRAQTLSRASRRLSLVGIAIGCVFTIMSIVTVVLVINRANYYQGRFYH